MCRRRIARVVIIQILTTIHLALVLLLSFVNVNKLVATAMLMWQTHSLGLWIDLVSLLSVQFVYAA